MFTEHKLLKRTLCIICMLITIFAVFSPINVFADCIKGCTTSHSSSEAGYCSTCAHIHKHCSDLCTLSHERTALGYCDTCRHIHAGTTHVISECNSGCSTAHAYSDASIMCKTCHHYHRTTTACPYNICGHDCEINHEETETTNGWSSRAKNYCTECSHYHIPGSSHRGGYVDPDADKCLLCGSRHAWERLLVQPTAQVAWLTAYVSHAGVFKIGDAVQQALSGGKASMTTNDLLLFSKDDVVFAPLFDDAASLYDGVSIIGIFMILIYFLFELVDVSLDKGFSSETFCKFILRALIGIMVVRNGMAFIERGMQICTEVVAELAESTSASTYAFSPDNCPWHDCIKVSLFNMNQIGISLLYTIPFLVNIVVFIIFQFTIWARVIEIIVRIIFAPIGMADILHSGMQSNGVRYFKKLLASVMQGACIYATIIAYTEIYNAIQLTEKGWLGIILVGLAFLTAIRQASRIAEEVVGVH